MWSVDESIGRWVTQDIRFGSVERDHHALTAPQKGREGGMTRRAVLLGLLATGAAATANNYVPQASGIDEGEALPAPEPKHADTESLTLEERFLRNEYPAWPTETEARKTYGLTALDLELKKRGTGKYRAYGPFLAALMEQESAFNPFAQSDTLALGLFQLMPKTGFALGITNIYGLDRLFEIETRDEGPRLVAKEKPASREFRLIRKDVYEDLYAALLMPRLHGDVMRGREIDGRVDPMENVRASVENFTPYVTIARRYVGAGEEAIRLATLMHNIGNVAVEAALRRGAYDVGSVLDRLPDLTITDPQTGEERRMLPQVGIAQAEVHAAKIDRLVASYRRRYSRHA